MGHFPLGSEMLLLPFITLNPCDEPHLLQSVSVHEYVSSNDPLIMRIHSSLGGVKPPAHGVRVQIPVTYVHAACVCVREREQQCTRDGVFNYTLWPVYYILRPDCICLLNFTYDWIISYKTYYSTWGHAVHAAHASRCGWGVEFFFF